MTDRQRNVFILVLVAGLIAASAVVIASKPTLLGLDLKGGIQLTYQGLPTPQTPSVTPAGAGSGGRGDAPADQSARRLGDPDLDLRQRPDQVGLPNVSNVKQAEHWWVRPPGWSSTTGRPTSSRPPASRWPACFKPAIQAALTISQGAGGRPGGAGAGSLGLYQAVKLAAKQPPYISKTNARGGAGILPVRQVRQRRLHGGCAQPSRRPRSWGSPATWLVRRPRLSDLDGELAQGVSSALAAQASPQTLKVNQGWVVMEAASQDLRQLPRL